MNSWTNGEQCEMEQVPDKLLPQGRSLFGYGRLKRGSHKMLTNRKLECWLQWIVPVSLDAQQERVGFGKERFQ